MKTMKTKKRFVHTDDEMDATVNVTTSDILTLDASMKDALKQMRGIIRGALENTNKQDEKEIRTCRTQDLL